MRRFSEDQKDLFFLSPYTDVLVRENDVMISQRLFGTEDRLVIPHDLAERLLSGLTKGITEEILSDTLREAGTAKPEKVIVRWMQMGILE